MADPVRYVTSNTSHAHPRNQSVCSGGLIFLCITKEEILFFKAYTIGAPVLDLAKREKEPWELREEALLSGKKGFLRQILPQ
jgi:hypothetical protein